MFAEQRFDVPVRLSEPVSKDDADRLFGRVLEFINETVATDVRPSFNRNMAAAGFGGAWIDQVFDGREERGLASWYQGHKTHFMTFRIAYEGGSRTAEMQAYAASIARECLERGLSSRKTKLAALVSETVGRSVEVADVMRAPSVDFAPVDDAGLSPERMIPLGAKFSFGDETMLRRADLRQAFAETMMDVSGLMAVALRSEGMVPKKIRDLGENGAECANGGRSLSEFMADRRYRDLQSLGPVVPALYSLGLHGAHGVRPDGLAAVRGWKKLNWSLATDGKPLMENILQRKLSQAGWKSIPSFRLESIDVSARSWQRWQSLRNGRKILSEADAGTRAEGSRMLGRIADAYAELLPAVRDKEGDLASRASKELYRLKKLKPNGGFLTLGDREMRDALVANGNILVELSTDVGKLLPAKVSFMKDLARRSEAAAAAFPSEKRREQGGDSR